MRSHRMPLGGIKAMHASALPKTSTALACVGDPNIKKTSAGGGRFQGTRRCLCEKGTKRGTVKPLSKYNLDGRDGG